MLAGNAFCAIDSNFYLRYNNLVENKPSIINFFNRPWISRICITAIGGLIVTLITTLSYYFIPISKPWILNVLIFVKKLFVFRFHFSIPVWGFILILVVYFFYKKAAKKIRNKIALTSQTEPEWKNFRSYKGKEFYAPNAILQL
jgi:hypothetical protein